MSTSSKGVERDEGSGGAAETELGAFEDWPFRRAIQAGLRVCARCFESPEGEKKSLQPGHWRSVTA